MQIRASESCGKRYRYVSKIPVPVPVLARVFLRGPAATKDSSNDNEP